MRPCKIRDVRAVEFQSGNAQAQLGKKKLHFQKYCVCVHKALDLHRCFSCENGLEKQSHTSA